ARCGWSDRRPTSPSNLHRDPSALIQGRKESVQPLLDPPPIDAPGAQGAHGLCVSPCPCPWAVYLDFSLFLQLFSLRGCAKLAEVGRGSRKGWKTRDVQPRPTSPSNLKNPPPRLDGFRARRTALSSPSSPNPHVPP